MIYVTSDLHGCPLEDLLSLLRSADFSDDDFLFVLGDVIDRGEHGTELLFWMSEQLNVQLILGNHEALLLGCSFLFEKISDENLEGLSKDKLDMLSAWLANGAGPTLAGLKKMMKSDPSVLFGILDMLRDAPLYDCVTVNGREFILVHSGFEGFEPERALCDYSPDELLWARPSIDTRYYDDGRIVVFGHTPTEAFDSDYSGRMLMTDSWICIDTGAATGKRPMLLRLDDLRPFYYADI
ncbi:MAG: metallophosphoesterase [Clostridia bacterium]|nr:metallophosphoesterase [Clostridia bacterium]